MRMPEVVQAAALILPLIVKGAALSVMPVLIVGLVSVTVVPSEVAPEISPTTLPAVSYRRRPVVPDVIVVVPTVMPPPAAAAHEGKPAASVKTWPLLPTPSRVSTPPELR